MRQRQVNVLTTFVRTVRSILEGLEDRECLTFSETGMSALGCKKRLDEHWNFNKSPLLLCLVRCAIARRHQSIGVAQFVICLTSSEVHIRLAEAIVTNLTSSYVKAGGCNHFEAGRASMADEGFWSDKLVETYRRTEKFRALMENIKKYHHKLLDAQKWLDEGQQPTQTFETRIQNQEAQLERAVADAKEDEQQFEAVSSLIKELDSKMKDSVTTYSSANRVAEASDPVDWDADAARLLEALEEYNQTFQEGTETNQGGSDA